MTARWTTVISAAALGLGLSWEAQGQRDQSSQAGDSAYRDTYQQEHHEDNSRNQGHWEWNQGTWMWNPGNVGYQSPGRYDRYGAPGDHQYRDPGHFQQGYGRSTTDDRAPTVMEGRIDSFRGANLSDNRGYRANHTLARLRLENGRTAIVDLGPTQNLQRLNFEPGDRIEVRGQFAQVGDRRVIVAQELKIDDTVTRIRQAEGRLGQSASRGYSEDADGRYGYGAQDRQRFDQRPTQTRSAQARSSQQRFGEQITLNGRLDGFRHVNLRTQQNERNQHSLVRVRLENGRSAIVDLGPKKDLDDLNLQTGKPISIQGRRGTIDGRSVVHANRIRFDGETHQIQRSARDRQPGDRPQGDRPQGDRQEDRDFTVRGTVRGYDLLSMRTGTDTLALLNLHLQDGRSILIDAGSEYTIGDFNLRKLDLDDRIIIRGQKKTIEGKPVLVVESIGAVSPTDGMEQIYGDSMEDRSGGQDQETRSSRQGGSTSSNTSG
jgi:hypothetical protein